MHEDPAVALLAETYLTFIRRSEDFLLFEQSAYEYGFEIMAAAMSAALEAYDDELSLQRPANWRVKDRTPRSPVSEVGQLSFSRRVHIDEVGERRYMLDEVLDLPKRARLTLGAFDKFTGFGVETSYHAAARLFNRHIDCGVTAPTVMNALRESAALLKGESEAAARRLFEDGGLRTESWSALRCGRGRRRVGPQAGREADEGRKAEGWEREAQGVRGQGHGRLSPARSLRVPPTSAGTRWPSTP